MFEKRNSTSPRETLAPSGEIDDRIKRIGNSFQKGLSGDKPQQNQMLVNLAIFLGVAAMMISGFLGWQLWRRKRMERMLNDPMFLVHELNSAHQLSEPEKRLMKELSEKNSLPTPLKVFVEPKFLLDAWDNDTFTASQPILQQLLSKLFDIVKVSESSPQLSQAGN